MIFYTFVLFVNKKNLIFAAVKRIGYILSDECEPLRNPLIVNVDSMDECVGDEPILIVGLERARNLIRDFSILNKCYGKVCWTYDKKERRNEYESAIVSFEKKCIEWVAGSVSYEYMLAGSLEELKLFFGEISPETACVIDGMCYVYAEEKIYGFSLDALLYSGVSEDDFISLIHCRIISESEIEKHVKKSFEGKEYLLVKCM